MRKKKTKKQKKSIDPIDPFPNPNQPRTRGHTKTMKKNITSLDKNKKRTKKGNIKKRTSANKDNINQSFQGSILSVLTETLIRTMKRQIEKRKTFAVIRFKDGVGVNLNNTSPFKKKKNNKHLTFANRANLSENRKEHLDE